MKTFSLSKILLSLVLGTSIISAADYAFYSDNELEKHDSHWSYEGDTGPSNWADLDVSYADCQNGKRQSPINFNEDSESYIISDAGIYLDYHDVELDILNNGHTIQVNFSEGNTALISGKKYKLLQLHFHAPSEHTIDGKPFAMEAHLVHKADDGELAVLGVMVQEGKHNSFLQKIFKNMPVHANETNKSQKVKINATNILPNSKDHYHYLGSLTTPPCTQIVEWYVLREPISISEKQLERFHKLYSTNARPVQELNDRAVLLKDKNNF